ncbi:MAG: flavin reductase [Defluviitaleaceae bacterium]|nr:flavin reductase [Defluviitaleaceae bacterium]
MIDKTALFKISYGLYLLSATDNDKDNACIVDAFMQVTATEPAICALSVNKQNFTHDLIFKTGKFNVSVLTVETPYQVFERFGLQSGKYVDKFAGFTENIERSKNGLIYLKEHTNAFMSFEVLDCVDFDTHTVFKAKITESSILSIGECVTYDYYRKHIKASVGGAAKGWVCNVCGYVHNGVDLPSSYKCPVCTVDATNFTKLS